MYGTIKKIIVIQNAETGKPRGYAFIEYEHERDMHCEYKFIVIFSAPRAGKKLIFNLKRLNAIGATMVAPKLKKKMIK